MTQQELQELIDLRDRALKTARLIVEFLKARNAQ